jgi:hypothetical protein
LGILLQANPVGESGHCRNWEADKFMPITYYDAKVFIAEHLVPGPETPHFSKLFDIHMMCAASGRERTIDQFSALFERAGWKYVQTLHPSSGLISVIEGKKSR